MEYQKIINFLDNKSNQPSELKTKASVEINNKSQGKYDKGNQITFKTLMLRSSLCDYGDAYITVTGTITAANTATHVAANNEDTKVLCTSKQYARSWCSWYWCSNANV